VRKDSSRSAAATPTPSPQPAEPSTLVGAPGVSTTLPSLDVVATLLKSAGTILECDVRGQSMGNTLPDGSRLRLSFEESPTLAVGDVVAFTANSAVTVHRVVGRGMFGPARSFVLTSGDGSLLLDHPVPVRDVLAIVREWRNGDTWQRVPVCGARGWRYVVRQLVLVPVLLALHVQWRLAMALTICGFATRAVLRTAWVTVSRRPQ